MTPVIFSLTVLAELLAAAGVTVSLLRPERRIWPPPHPGAWQARCMWTLFAASGLGIVALGLLDWSRSAFPAWLRWTVGAPLWLFGGGLALWALVTLGMAKSFGDSGEIVRRGPYRFSRNPQYVGFIASLAGWGFVAGSIFTLLAALAGSLALVLAPFAEEPWLAKMYSEAYAEYTRSVPRFIGVVKNNRPPVL